MELPRLRRAGVPPDRSPQGGDGGRAAPQPEARAGQRGRGDQGRALQGAGFRFYIMGVQKHKKITQDIYCILMYQIYKKNTIVVS